MDKRIARYTKVYGKAAAHAGISGKDAIVASFAGRLEDMYASELFRTHNVYPTINVEHVYAVIAYTPAVSSTPPK